MKRYKEMLIGALLLTMLVVNTAAPATAYAYGGAYWHIYYAQVNQDSSIPSGWTNSISAATSTWNNAGTTFYFSWIATNNKLSYGPLTGVLASTYPVFSGDSMISCKTTFNSNQPWSTSGASGYYDVQSVATHELGHWLYLEHSSVSAAVMYPTLAAGQTKRTLTSDDINGIKSIYR